MAIIKDFDWVWFWRGYACGANSKKKILESPNKVVNLGKQGIKTKLTEKQQLSFSFGAELGGRKVVQNFNLVQRIQYQDKNAHRSSGDYLTAGIGSIETSKGATFSLPFYIANNTVDNRGYIGYQYKIYYPYHYMTLNSITPSSSWQGSFEYQHDAENGIVLVQGINDVVSYDDVVFGYLNFTLKEDAPNKMTVQLMGPTGQGTGTDLLTYFNEEFYYIQPIKLQNGKVVIVDDSQTSSTTNNNIYPSISLPPRGSNRDPIFPDSEFTYDFDCDLRYVGEGVGSGADLVIKITFGDGTSTVVRIPLEEGDNHYSGKIPIKLPSITTGPIQIEMWVEPEDPNDIYYWFIKAGALWSFITEIPREEVGTATTKTQHIDIYENMSFIDGFTISNTPAPVPPSPSIKSKEDIQEIMQLLDGFVIRYVDSGEEKEEEMGEPGVEKSAFGDGFTIRN